MRINSNVEFKFWTNVANYKLALFVSEYEATIFWYGKSGAKINAFVGGGIAVLVDKGAAALSDGFEVEVKWPFELVGLKTGSIFSVRTKRMEHCLVFTHIDFEATVF